MDRKSLRPLVTEARSRVAAELPEDEHDYTAPWVYEIAIRVGIEAAQRALLETQVRAELEAFMERIGKRGAAREAARTSLILRVRQFMDKWGRNGSKTGRSDYVAIVALSEFEPLRVALAEYDRMLTVPIPALDAEREEEGDASTV